jgi:hypothetical protein
MKIRFKTSIQLRNLVGVILLVCGFQLYGQQTVSGADDAPPPPKYITFDPAGSQGTTPTAINPAGAITGYYFQFVGQSPPRGFLRAPNGTFITFDYPNTSHGTSASAINPAGTITGNYFANNQYHGFLRARNGTFITFDPPGSTNTTQPQAINPAGEITGWYYDAYVIPHGFLRIPAQPDE